MCNVRMQHARATCIAQHAWGNVRNATCTLQHAWSRMICWVRRVLHLVRLLACLFVHIFNVYSCLFVSGSISISDLDSGRQRSTRARCLFTCRSFCTSTCRSLFVCLFVCLFVYPPVCLSCCFLFVCLAALEWLNRSIWGQSSLQTLNCVSPCECGLVQRIAFIIVWKRSSESGWLNSSLIFLLLPLLPLPLLVLFLLPLPSSYLIQRT